MEILLTEEVMRLSGWFFLIIALAFGALVAVLGGLIVENENMLGVGGSMALLIIILGFTCPLNVPSGKYTYVVEITEPSKYQELVDKGYKFNHLYSDRTIYEITGDKLEVD